MNWLDIVIAVILVVSVIAGLRAGLIRMVVSLAGILLGVFLAGRYYQALGERLTFISSDKGASIAAYVLILVLVIVVAGLIAWLLSKAISAIALGWLNRVGGAVLGLFSTAVFIGAVLAVWAKYGGGGETIGSSVLGSFLLDKFPLVLALLPGEFGTVRSFFQ